MKENFKLGQIVKAKKNIDYIIRKNDMGKIVHLIQEGNFLGVEWFNFNGGHNCSGLGKNGYCWYVLDECIIISGSSQLEFDF